MGCSHTHHAQAVRGSVDVLQGPREAISLLGGSTTDKEFPHSPIDYTTYYDGSCPKYIAITNMTLSRVSSLGYIASLTMQL